jgi:hypothetical protein
LRGVIIRSQLAATTAHKIDKNARLPGQLMSPTCLLVTLRASQFFILTAAAFFLLPKASATLNTGETYALKFVDLDGRTLVSDEGHVSVVVLTIRADIAKAELVGTRVPDYCLGNPEYRMITVVNFGRGYGVVARRLATSLMRRRIDNEAAQLQRRYDARGIHKDARRDVFVVGDFDGTISQRLGAGQRGVEFRVFVFGRDGKLLRQWADLPSAPELAAVVK